MRHRWFVIGPLFCAFLVLPACKNYEKENQHLREELRMVREESDYLKAEIVGLKKEMTQLSARVEDEKLSLQKKFEEERDQMRKKVQEEREVLQKRLAEATKKRNEIAKKEPLGKENGSAKKDVKESVPIKKEVKESTSKPGQPHQGDTKASPAKNPF